MNRSNITAGCEKVKQKTPGGTKPPPDAGEIIFYGMIAVTIAMVGYHFLQAWHSDNLLNAAVLDGPGRQGNHKQVIRISLGETAALLPPARRRSHNCPVTMAATADITSQHRNNQSFNEKTEKVSAAASPTEGWDCNYPVWLDELVEALALKESSGLAEPPDGDGGGAVGPLQLHTHVIDDLNHFLKTNFTYEDRRDPHKARIIAKLYMWLWLEFNKYEIAARIFNGGPSGWRYESTNDYWQDVKTILYNQPCCE